MRLPRIMVALSVIILLMALCATKACAQGHLSARQRSILDRLYLSSTGSISGTLIIDGTISTGKLDFAVVPFADFTNLVAEFQNFTNTARLRATTRFTAGSHTLTNNEDAVFCDTDDGDVTLILPAGIDGREFRFINSGSSGNIVTLQADGIEAIAGSSDPLLITDGDVLVVVFEPTEGWW